MDYLNYICENLAGSLSLYNMRMIMAPSDTERAAALVEKLDFVNHGNYMFTVVLEESETEPEDVTNVVTDEVSVAEQDG